MPVFDILERSAVKRLSISRGVVLRLIVRSAYVGQNLFKRNTPTNFVCIWLHYTDIYIVAAFTLFIGVTFPFFGDLLGFFGGFGFAPTSYFVRPRQHHIINPHLSRILFHQYVSVCIINYDTWNMCSYLASYGWKLWNHRDSAGHGLSIG